MKESSSVFEIIDETLNNSYNKLYLKEIWEIAGVSRSGYYAWKNSASVRAEREEADRRDFELILAAYKKRGYSKGAKGIYGPFARGKPSKDESEKDTSYHEEIWAYVSRP